MKKLDWFNQILFKLPKVDHQPNKITFEQLKAALITRMVDEASAHRIAWSITGGPEGGLDD